MNVAFDARMITHPGIGRYIRSLLCALIATARDSTFTLYGDPGSLRSFGQFGNCCLRKYNVPIYSLREALFNPLSRTATIVTHVPNFNVPLHRPQKLVVTIHDLIYLKIPQTRTFFKGVGAHFLIRRALEGAARIIAVSENTRRDIVEFCPSVERKIRVVYEAAAPSFRKITHQGVLEGVKKKYNLPPKFILFVGSLRRHKNIEGLLEAYIQLKKSRRVDISLVITGRFHPPDRYIWDRIRSTDAIYLGEVSHADLVALYNCAACFCNLSLYEGFGLTILEAQRCGLAVVCSNIAPHREVGGEGVCSVDPTNVDQIEESLYNVLTKIDYRDFLISKGLENAERFSWTQAAEATLNIYKELQ